MIRKAVPEDSRRIAEIRGINWRTHFVKIISSKYLFDTLNICEKAKEYYEQIEKGKGVFIVSENDEIIDGYMILKILEESRIIQIGAIYVEPYFMRKGIGSELMKYCENLTHEMGFNRIIVWTFQDNCIGRAFYNKHGFMVTNKDVLYESLNILEVKYEKNLL
jgi:diamine N-acetyltransferase